MEIVSLLVTASIPVLKVLLVTALGSYLALDRVNILGDAARNHLNTLVFYVLNPALVGSKLAKTITYESMVKLWFMPVNILITFIVGSALGWIVIQVTRPPRRLRGLILGCSAAGNLGNLPLVIIPALCKEKGSPFGDPDVCYTYGMAYASLSMAIGALYLWSYVYNIVRISSESAKDCSEIEDVSDVKSEPSAASDAKGPSQPLLSSVPHSDSDQDTLPVSMSDHGKSQVVDPKTLGIKQRIGKLFKNINLKALFAPSTTGAIAGFAIGLVPIIRKSLIGPSAPLRVIQDSADFLGDAAIPALTLIIGGNLVKGLKGGGMQKSIVIGIVMARFVALPLIGIAIVKGAIRWGLVNPDDALYQFVLLLQFAVPPAMNIGTITQLFGAGENECSVIMLWCYSLAALSLTFWSTFFMWLVA